MSTHANRGRALERSILRGASKYPGVALRKQETPTAMGGQIYVGSAPIDFLGIVQGRPAALEAKQRTTGDSLPVEVDANSLTHTRDWWSKRQQDALQEQYELGAWTRLVVAFDAHRETYAVDWPALSAFLAAPWRNSLSLAWCRAYGLLVPEDHREDEKRRLCRFLDGQAHVYQQEALALVLVERERGRIERQKPAPKPVVTMSDFARMTAKEKRDHLFESTIAGIQNQAKRERRGR